MHRRIVQPFLALAIVALLLIPLGLTASTGTADAFNYSKLKPIQKKILSGFADLELNPNSPALHTAAPTSFAGAGAATAECPVNLASNVRVNQDCQNISNSDLAGRAQAQNETAIAEDPLNPQHLVAFYNNYQRGDGDCIGAYSVNGGKTWSNSYAPSSFTYGTNFGGYPREYWQAHGDPSVAWDTKGNAYLSCQMFNRGTSVTSNSDQSSAVYLFRSTGDYGASWNFPGVPVIEFYDPTGTSGALEDKPYMTVDNHVGSPFQDRIYVTYTEFASDGTGYLYEAYSSDYGQTFNPRVLVSTNSTTLCTNTYGLPTDNGNCNENQFSDPFTGPDGSLYVVYANYNNGVSGPNDNHYQMLLVKSTDGGNTFSAPVLVGNYYELPDCATYQNGQDAGRACVPEKNSTANSVFRAANYPSASVNPTNPSEVVVTYPSYINKYSNETNQCVPAGFSPTYFGSLYLGVKQPGACNNGIVLSVSTNGGTSFTGTTTDVRKLPLVTSAEGQRASDQYFQWTTYTKNGALVVSYFDRQYGLDETSGYSDVSLSSSRTLSDFATQRVTTSSMPPETQFSGDFFGDYSGVTAVTSAFPLWMDSRMDELFVCPGTGVPGVPPTLCTGTATNAAVANDQNVFTQKVAVP